jgi:tetratricopeptide (TPR) repeat protein
MIDHLAAAIAGANADRAAVLWLDEYNPGLVHVHCLLDLVNDVPRRKFPVQACYSAWHDGVPSFVDMPSAGGARDSLGSGGARSTCWVSMGSDGTKAWFLTVDSVTPRGPLSTEAMEELMFRAGEASAVVLHRDLGRRPFEALGLAGRGDLVEDAPFPGWMILKDIQGREDDPKIDQRIAARFLVGRAVWAVLDEDWAMDAKALKELVNRVQREFEVLDPADSERSAWCDVMHDIEGENIQGLGRSILALADCLDLQEHLHGACEFLNLAYQIAVASGSGSVAGEAARFLGSTHRRLGSSEESTRWYEIALDMGEVFDDSRLFALALGGIGHTLREKGNLPGAFEAHRRSLDRAVALGDPYVIGFAHHNLMTDEKLAGRMSAAIKHGWEAVQLYPTEPDRLRALTDLAWTFVEARDLCAAEDAYLIVARRSEHFLYRAYALGVLAYIQALRGNEPAFKRRLEVLDQTPWLHGSPYMVSELLMNRGEAYEALGNYEQALEWFERARDFSAEHGNHQVTFKVEAMLESIPPAKPAGPGHARLGTPATTLEGVTGVRDGLSALRQELAPV